MRHQELVHEDLEDDCAFRDGLELVPEGHSFAAAVVLTLGREQVSNVGMGSEVQSSHDGEPYRVIHCAILPNASKLGLAKRTHKECCLSELLFDRRLLTLVGELAKTDLEVSAFFEEVPAAGGHPAWLG